MLVMMNWRLLKASKAKRRKCNIWRLQKEWCGRRCAGAPLGELMRMAVYMSVDVFTGAVVVGNRVAHLNSQEGEGQNMLELGPSACHRRSASVVV